MLGILQSPIGFIQSPFALRPHPITPVKAQYEVRLAARRGVESSQLPQETAPEKHEVDDHGLNAAAGVETATR
jgi:hypothetical protein